MKANNWTKHTRRMGLGSFVIARRMLLIASPSALQSQIERATCIIGFKEGSPGSLTFKVAWPLLFHLRHTGDVHCAD